MSGRAQAYLFGAALLVVGALAPEEPVGARETAAMAEWLPVGLIAFALAALALWAVRWAARRSYRRRHAAAVAERAASIRHTERYARDAAELSVPVIELREAETIDAYLEGVIEPWMARCRAAGYRHFESRQEFDRFVWRAYR